MAVRNVSGQALPVEFTDVPLIQFDSRGCVEISNAGLMQLQRSSKFDSRPSLDRVLALYAALGCHPDEARLASAQIHEVLKIIDDPEIRIINKEWLQSDPDNSSDRGPSYYRYEILLNSDQVQKLGSKIQDGQKITDHPTKPTTTNRKFASGFSSIERNGNKLIVEIHPEDSTIVSLI